MRIIDIGCNSIHLGDFSICRPNGYGAYLFLRMRTKAFIEYKNEIKEIAPNTFILYSTNSRQYYGSVGNTYVDDWIHFELDEYEENLLSTYDIKLDTPFNIANTSSLEQLLQNLTLEFYSVNHNKQASQKLYMELLFAKLQEAQLQSQKEKSAQLSAQFSQLRSDIYNMPNRKWKLDDIARQFNYSVSYFQHTYKKMFGTTITDDVSQSRIHLAKLLLSGTSLSVKDISTQCGYEYDVYFMRQFKKITGITPSQFRTKKRTATKAVPQ